MNSAKIQAEMMKMKRVNHMKVHNTAWKMKNWDLKTNPKIRKTKYACIHTEQKKLRRTSKK